MLPGQVALADGGEAESTVARVSTAADGGELDGPSHIASISAGGRYVVFWTGAPLLGGGGDHTHVPAVKDLRTGRVERIPGARRDDGAGIDNTPRISADGRFVAYSTGTVGNRSAHLHDRRTGRTAHLTPPPGSPAAGGTGEVTSLSADGRSVAFRAIGPAPGGPVLDYVQDTVTGRMELVTPRAPGENATYGVVRGSRSAVRGDGSRTCSTRRRAPGRTSSSGTAGPVPRARPTWTRTAHRWPTGP
ncbi:TolB family protein [Streptomyces sp. Ac-502]|uniref:TolB family protein n=1 Tax=Streptomyces sp. Ac-502 TaxID=3342801 RepID=UPI0038628151